MLLPIKLGVEGADEFLDILWSEEVSFQRFEYEVFERLSRDAATTAAGPSATCSATGEVMPTCRRVSAIAICAEHQTRKKVLGPAPIPESRRSSL